MMTYAQLLNRIVELEDTVALLREGLQAKERHPARGGPDNDMRLHNRLARAAIRQENHS